MTADLDQAVNETSALFKAAWDANSGVVFGYIPEIEWEGVPSKTKVDQTRVWGRFSTQNVFEEQATLSDCAGEPFKRRYAGSGLVFLQLFLPKTVANALPKGRTLAKVARNAFRGKKTSGGVWYLNARIVDVPPEELFYRLNVVAEYEYDTLG